MADFDSIKSNGTTTTTSEIFKAILKPQNIPIPEPLKVYDIPQPIVLKPEIIVCENGLRRSILKLPEPELISHGGGAYGSNGTKQLPKPKFLVCGGASVESFDTHALKETTTLVFVRAKKELESKLADSILVGTPTCHDFLDFIATERLRSMPHKGSKWDKILKWAESYARSVDRYAKEVSGLMVHTWESARLVWGCCKMLLQVSFLVRHRGIY